MLVDIFKFIFEKMRENKINIKKQLWYFVSSHNKRKIQFAIIKSIIYMRKEQYSKAINVLDKVEIDDDFILKVLKLKMSIYKRSSNLHSLKELIDRNKEIFETKLIHDYADFVFSTAKIYWYLNYQTETKNNLYPNYTMNLANELLEKSVNNTNVTNSKIVPRVINSIYSKIFLLKEASESEDRLNVENICDEMLKRLNLIESEPLFYKTKELIVKQFTINEDIKTIKIAYEDFLNFFDIEKFINERPFMHPNIYLAIWLSIERILHASGFFVATIYARKNAINSYILGLKKTDKKDINLVACLIEKGEFEEAKEVLENIKISNSTKKKFLAYIYLLEGNSDRYIELIKDIFNYSDKFYNYLSNKSVAIVGPAVVENNGIEIDNHDIVVRLNSMGDIPSDTLNYGSKTDIVSYNVEKLARFKAQGNMKLNPWVKFGLVKSSRFIDGVDGLKDKAIIKNNFFACMLPVTHLIHIPILIPFLYGYKPSKIKLFNSNFFISEPEKAYTNDYRAVSSVPILLFDNQVVGFNFTKKIFMSKVFEADLDAERILKLTDFEYARALEKLYQPERKN